MEPWLCPAECAASLLSDPGMRIQGELPKLWLCHSDARQVFDLPSDPLLLGVSDLRS
jgi:hypothetical protein